MTAPLFDTSLDIIDAGPGWLAILKPAGISVHNEPGFDVRTLVIRHIDNDPALAAALAYTGLQGVHAVHRLDKETSGVLLLACRRDILGHFNRQFHCGAARKVYFALVHGSINMDSDNEWSDWSWPLTKTTAGRQTPQGAGKRVACKTRYRPIQQTNHYTLIECALVTGRKHQIRRHTAIAGHPVLGDRRYGSPRACRYLTEHFGFSRLGLHAAVLEVMLPGSNEYRRFEAPNLPADLRCLMEKDS